MKKMSVEAKQRLDEANAKATDWWGVCRLCGQKVTGTLKDLMAHKCDVKHE